MYSLNDVLPIGNAGYHSDDDLLEPLMCGTQVRVLWERERVNSNTDCELVTTGFKQFDMTTSSLAILYINFDVNVM